MARVGWASFVVLGLVEVGIWNIVEADFDLYCERVMDHYFWC